jgi:hypothetical protein
MASRRSGSSSRGGESGGQRGGVGVAGEGEEDLTALGERRGAVLEERELGGGGFGVAEELADLREEFADFGVVGRREGGDGGVPIRRTVDFAAAEGG